MKDAGIEDDGKLSVWVQMKSQGVNQDNRAKISFWNSGGSFITDNKVFDDTVDNNWRTFTGTVDVPYQAAEFKVQFFNDSGNDPMSRRRLMVVRGPIPKAWVTEIRDGTINTPQLKANAVEADKIKTDSFLTNEILANSAEISDTLTVGANGKITNNASTKDYRMDSDGLDFRATTSARDTATEVSWLESDLAGTVRGEIYVHNSEMNISSYRFGSSNFVRTVLTAYDRPKGQNPKEYARIELKGEQYDNNEVNVILTDSDDKFTIGDGAPVFDFQPDDYGMGFREFYNFDSNPGPHPSAPIKGIRLFAKEETHDNNEPVLWFITENNNQYRVDVTQIS
jgi:hypothetical protein